MSVLPNSETSRLRDLQVLLIGYALCKEGRAVLSHVPEGSLEPEFEAMARALRGESHISSVTGWLNEHGVRVGKVPIDDIIHRIVYIRSRERINYLTGRMKMAASGDLTDPKARDYLAGLARELLATIHETPEQEVSAEGG